MKDIQETMTCPHCGRTLQKSAAVYVQGLIGAAPGDVRSVPCPGCGGAIDVLRMISGDFDVRPESGWETLLGLGLVGGGTFAVHRVTGFNGFVCFGLVVLVLAGFSALFLRRRAR